jgi:GGDEF domain-containing protein
MAAPSMSLAPQGRFALAFVFLIASGLSALRLGAPRLIPGVELLICGWLGITVGRLTMGSDAGANAFRAAAPASSETLERAEEAGLRDVVTMIGNRRYFEATFVEEVVKARRSGDDLCIALADLDRFKLVNDRFGHLVGDRVLRSFADILLENVRGQDKAARFGGDEFGVIFPGPGWWMRLTRRSGYGRRLNQSPSRLASGFRR